jgi:GTP-binding protein
MKPIVAIVGRPNVGKSTLFNRLVGKRVAIVDDNPGVTRDRIYSEAEWLTHRFILIDTGGIEPESEDIILSQMKKQAELAIETADVIVFMTDGKEGITSADQDVAAMLRKTNKPVVLAVNKVDNLKMQNNVYEFYNLGIGDPIGISSSLGLGTGDLLDAIVSSFKKFEYEDEDEEVTKVAIVGRPNVGKSSLVNKLLNEERVIVSDIPGTTRDAVDTPMEVNGERYILIDTAGIRRKSKVSEGVERYSVIRSLSAIERADVCLIMIDALESVTEQDSKIAGIAHEAGKAIIIVVNKWDAVEKDDKTLNRFTENVRSGLSFAAYAPIIFISAKTGQRVNRLIGLIKYVANQNSMRVSTGVLNDVIADSVMMNQPPSVRGRKLKILYGTQASTKPPTFVLFVNDPELMHFSYERYLENQMRSRFGLEGTPIRFIYRARDERQGAVK